MWHTDVFHKMIRWTPTLFWHSKQRLQSENGIHRENKKQEKMSSVVMIKKLTVNVGSVMELDLSRTFLKGPVGFLLSAGVQRHSLALSTDAALQLAQRQGETCQKLASFALPCYLSAPFSALKGFQAEF